MPQVEEIDDADYDMPVYSTGKVQPLLEEVDFPRPETGGAGSGGDFNLSSSDIQYVSDTSQFKHWTCVYPLYFDTARTRGHGRRVSSRAAVRNPLAKTISDACRAMGVGCALEPQKTHPRDWANPGRVRVMFKEEDGSVVMSKRALYDGIAEYLGLHPTTKESPMELPIAGLPTQPSQQQQEEDGKMASVPKGRRAHINGVLPLHSPALSGGGVSDNILRDMMQDEQLQQVASGSNSGSNNRRRR